MSHDDAASSTSTFEQFLKAMGPKMKRLLAANHIPIEDAEDVLQQALLALVYQWDSIRDPESWLLGTLRRNCFMYWRSYRRRLYSAVDSTLLEMLSQPMAPPQERSDLLYDLRHMIARLPPRCRSLLELRFQLGYEPSEVARRLGYRESSIGKITNRCLAALAREMVRGAVVDPPLAGAGPLAPLEKLAPLEPLETVAAAGPARAPDELPASALPLGRLSPLGAAPLPRR